MFSSICLFYLCKMMNGHLTYCSNHFMMYVKSNYYAIHTLKLYKAVVHAIPQPNWKRKIGWSITLGSGLGPPIIAQMGIYLFLPHTIFPNCVTGKAHFLTKIQGFPPIATVKGTLLPMVKSQTSQFTFPSHLLTNGLEFPFLSLVALSSSFLGAIIDK